MMPYLLQFFFFFFTATHNYDAEQEVERTSLYQSWFSLCVFFSPPCSLLESFHSDRARRDLDREPKACTHKHRPTCPPVAACHGHILCCQSAAEAADNSCHFTLVAPGWNSFIPPTDSVSPRWSSSELILPLSIPFCCTLPFFSCNMLLSPYELLSRLLLSSDKPIALRWERVEDFTNWIGHRNNWKYGQRKWTCALFWMLGLLSKSIFYKHSCCSSIWLCDTAVKCQDESFLFLVKDERLSLTLKNIKMIFALIRGAHQCSVTLCRSIRANCVAGDVGICLGFGNDSTSDCRISKNK